jgi:predicted outer membrane repeat protein
MRLFLLLALFTSPTAAAMPPMPTPYPTAVPTEPPTPYPTTYPTTVYNCEEAVTSWAALKYCCEAGGNEVILSETFAAGANPGQITVTGTCVIRGSGEVLDADGSNRVFSISDPDASLEIDGLTLRRGIPFDDTNGGAIKITAGALCIKNTTFDGNTAGWPRNNQDGGAIYAFGPVNVKIYTTTFKGCQSSSEGGAIYAAGGVSMEIHNSTFKGNSAVEGGAICLVCDACDSGTVLINNGIFDSNTASGSGGAISVKTETFSHPLKVDIYWSSFLSNVAEGFGGGAMYISQATGSSNIYNSVFEGSKSFSGAGTGGAIYVVAVGGAFLRAIRLEQVIFRSNDPSSYDGAVTHFCGDTYFLNAVAKSCQRCPVGTYKDAESAGHLGLTSCTDCSTGRYGDPGVAQASSEHCPKCPAGYYGSVQRASHCAPCPSGRYGQFPGAPRPSLCNILPLPLSRTSHLVILPFLLQETPLPTAPTNVAPAWWPSALKVQPAPLLRS